MTIRWKPTETFVAVVHGKQNRYLKDQGYNYDPERTEHRDLGRKLFGHGEEPGWVKEGKAVIIAGGEGGVTGGMQA